MKTAQILIGLTVVTGIYLLAKTEKGEALMEDVADGVKKLSKKISGIAEDTSTELASFTKKVSKGIDGLSDDAHEKIMEILKEGEKVAKQGKKALSNMA